MPRSRNYTVNNPGRATVCRVQKETSHLSQGKGMRSQSCVPVVHSSTYRPSPRVLVKAQPISLSHRREALCCQNKKPQHPCRQIKLVSAALQHPQTGKASQFPAPALFPCIPLCLCWVQNETLRLFLYTLLWRDLYPYHIRPFSSRLESRTHPDIDAPHIDKQNEVAQSAIDLEGRVMPHVLAPRVVRDAVPHRPSLRWHGVGYKANRSASSS